MIWASLYPVIKNGKDSVYELGLIRQANSMAEIESYLAKNNKRGEIKQILVFPSGELFSVESGNALKLILK